MKNDIIAQLKLLQQHPRFGARSVESLAADRRKLMLAIGADPDAPARQYGWREYMEYYRAMVMPKMVRTLGAATAGFALLLGGWLTTVNAASRSLPGDPLYGLKIITEQAQLRLASLEERAVLHTAFAERRLQEAGALKEQPAAQAQAYAAFTQEISSANNDLQELQVNGSASAAATASIVEGRIDALDTALNETVATSGGTSTEVQAAKDASREVQSTAVAVIVDDHEEEQTEQSQRELKELFLRDYGNVQARQEFDLHRVDVVRNAMRVHAALLAPAELPTEADLTALARAISGVADEISEAMNSFAIGAYRNAFDVLHSLDGELLLVEARLAQAEITITTALSAPPPAP